MRFSEALADYCQLGRYDLDQSTATFHVYSARLKQFGRWMVAEGVGDPDVSDISFDLIRRYYLGVKKQGFRPRTVRSHAHAIKMLFSYLHGQGRVGENVAKDLKLPKLDDAQRPLVSDEDLQKLLEAAQRQGSDFRCVRDKAVIALFSFTGMRRQECLSLKAEDVNLDSRLLVIQKGKNSKERKLPICKDLHSALTDWLELRRTLTVSTDRLFTIPGGRPLGRRALTGLINNALAIAGMKGDQRVKTHAIRHHVGTRLLQHGMDLRSVQDWLGHEELRTTEKYLHSNLQVLCQGVEKVAFQPKEAPLPTTKRKEDVSRQASHQTFLRRRGR